MNIETLKQERTSLEKEREKLRASLQKNRSDAEENGRALDNDKTLAQLHAQEEELRTRIRSLRKPYEQKESRLREQRYKLEDDVKTLNDEISTLTANIIVISAEEAPITTEEAHAVLAGVGAAVQSIDEEAQSDDWGYFKHRKTLSNGVKVFQDKDSEKNRYFAFQNKTFVGFWAKRTPEHRGDSSESECWVGVKKMTYENQIIGRLTEHEDEKMYWGAHLTYFNWLSVLEGKQVTVQSNRHGEYTAKPRKLFPIDLMDHGNREMLKRAGR